jgi:membrane protease YdiL (CAAX protease family)
MPAPGEPSADLPEDPAGPEPRELRNLVPFEIAAVLALAIAPLPDVVPVALPLLVIATVSRWVRRRSFGQLMRADGWTVANSATAGLVALAIAVIAGAPFVELMSGRAVEWSAFPIVRGSASQLVLVALMVIAMVIASELALRGWIVERMLELSPGPPVLPVLVGALAEALVTPGDVATRIGAGLFGAGLGALYVAAGRSVIAPICARLAFSLGALVLEALRVIG